MSTNKMLSVRLPPLEGRESTAFEDGEDSPNIQMAEQAEVLGFKRKKKQ